MTPEIQDYGTTIVCDYPPEGLDPYGLLQYCDNVEREGDQSYRFDGVNPDTKDELIAILKGEKPIPPEARFEGVMEDVDPFRRGNAVAIWKNSNLGGEFIFWEVDDGSFAYSLGPEGELINLGRQRWVADSKLWKITQDAKQKAMKNQGSESLKLLKSAIGGAESLRFPMS